MQDKRQTDSESLSVHLVRHGQTESYDHDAGLTELGQAQVRDRAARFCQSLHDGQRLAFGYAPTERARQTAQLLHAAIRRHAEENGTRIVGDAMTVEPGYHNVQVWADGAPQEPTRTRTRLAELAAAGEINRHGWAIEANRFWRAHEESGDAMTYWLRTPLLFHESPAAVISRAMLTTLAKLNNGVRGRLIIGTHSGLLRAILNWATDDDPGEPPHAAELVLTVTQHSDLVTVTYQDQDWPMRIPTQRLNWTAAELMQLDN